jgi:hypothetical protein
VAGVEEAYVASLRCGWTGRGRKLSAQRGPLRCAARAAPDLQRLRVSRQILERVPGPPVHDALDKSKHARETPPVGAPVVRSPLARPPGRLAPAAAPQQGRPER